MAQAPKPPMSRSTLRRLLAADRERHNEARLRGLESIEGARLALDINTRLYRDLLGEEPPDATLQPSLDATGLVKAS